MEHSPNSKNTLIHLISEYEALSQKGDITKLEEKSLLKLIHFFNKEYKKEKALEVVEHALDLYPFSVEFFIKKAEILTDCKLYEDAYSVVDMAETLAPADVQLKLLKSRIFATQGRFDIAMEIISELKAHAEFTDISEVLYAEACILEMMRDFDGTFNTLKEILESNDMHDAALDKIWYISDMSRMHEHSKQLHHQLIDRNPYNYRAWYNLGQASASLGEYEQAIQAFEYAFIIYPEFETAYKECADLCFEIGKYNKALKIYMEALEVFGADLDLFHNVGQCLLYLGNPKSARKYFNKALKVDPYNDEIHYSIGLTFARESRWINAINAYKRALDLDDMREEYFAGLGEAFFHINEFDKARYYFNKAIKYGPEQSFIWLAYANFLMATNHLSKAIDLLDKAEYYTQSVDLEYCKSACYFLKEDRESGLKTLESALEKDFSMHSMLFQFAPYLQFDADIQSMIKYYKEQ
jgi:tetratricopeptide (TPR) repeat protein